MSSKPQKSAQNLFSAEEIDKIQAETFVRQIEYHNQLASTNDRALEIARSSDKQFPLLVLASRQTAGRGRGANTWWSEDGSLTFSVMLATDAVELPTECWPQVSLTVGLSVCEALEQLLAAGVPTGSLHTLPSVQLKWPNDVYIEGKKICGILVEVPKNCPGKLLLGIGVNINNSLREAPDDLEEIATSLYDLTGRSFSLSQVLTQVLQQLARRLEPATFWNAEVLAGWRQRCYLTDKRIEIDNDTRKAIGTCRGIDSDGALLVINDATTERHLAGVVTVLP